MKCENKFEVKLNKSRSKTNSLTHCGLCSIRCHHTSQVYIMLKGWRLKVKRCSSPEPVISQLRSVTCHMGSHSVTCHLTQVNTPRLYPSQTGRYLIYPPRRDGRLSWPRCTVMCVCVILRNSEQQVSINFNKAAIVMVIVRHQLSGTLCLRLQKVLLPSPLSRHIWKLNCSLLHTTRSNISSAASGSNSRHTAPPINVFDIWCLCLCL